MKTKFLSTTTRKIVLMDMFLLGGLLSGLLIGLSAPVLGMLCGIFAGFVTGWTITRSISVKREKKEKFSTPQLPSTQGATALNYPSASSGFTPTTFPSLQMQVA